MEKASKATSQAAPSCLAAMSRLSWKTFTASPTKFGTGERGSRTSRSMRSASPPASTPNTCNKIINWEFANIVKKKKVAKEFPRRGQENKGFKRRRTFSSELNAEYKSSKWQVGKASAGTYTGHIGLCHQKNVELLHEKSKMKYASGHILMPRSKDGTMG
jgi:hypothetical protein